jgi:hypothetical protein
MTFTIRSTVCSRSPGIDPFGAVAEEEVAAALQPGMLFEKRPAYVFRDARIDGAFVDDDRPLRRIEHGGDRLRRADDGAEVRDAMLVDRGRHGDDVDVRALCFRGVARQGESRGAQRISFDFAGTVLAGAELGDAGRIDVEPGDPEGSGKRDGEREADIAETDHHDVQIG